MESEFPFLMGSAADWHKFLDEFRSFGGRAENVMQRKGAFGLGLFPIDSAKPIELRVPDQLLVPTSNVELQDSEIVIKDDDNYPDGYSDWFRRYQSSYSWGAEGRQNTLTIEEGLKALPEEALLLLKRSGLYNAEKRFPEEDTEQELLLRFIQTRCINRKGNRVIMPMIELLNHSPSADTYDMKGDGISVDGLYDGEILVKYSNSDPIRRFINYGFNAPERLGFSLPLKLKHREQNVAIRGGNGAAPNKPCNVEIKNNTIIIEQPLLASVQSPKMPRTLFIQGLQNINGINANELFDQIHQRNSRIYIELIRILYKVEGDTADKLCCACLNQLTALSHRYGQRDDLLNKAANSSKID